MKTELYMKNFRGIKEGKIEFSQVNILLGPNNSGKSTILEALFLLPNPARVVPYAKLEKKNRMKFQIRSLKAIELIHELHKTYESEGYVFLIHNYRSRECKILLHTRSANLSLLLISNKFYIDLAMCEKDNEFFIKSLRKYANTLDSNPATEFCQKMKKLENISPIESYISSVTGEALYFHPNLLEYAWNYFASRWVEIVGPETTRRIAEKVSELVYDDYVDLLMEPFGDGKSALYLYMKDGRRIRLGDVGDGIKQIITLMLLYTITRPKFLLIDDVESHMNPVLLSFLTRWLADLVEKENVNLIVSTHSIEAAKLIAGIMLELNPRIILTSIIDGELKCKYLTLEEVEELEKSGVDVRVSQGLLL